MVLANHMAADLMGPDIVGRSMARVEREASAISDIRRLDGTPYPAEDLPHVSERFYRADNTGGVEGTGIGLASVREVVEQHGGTMAIASREGVGTTVTVRLPLSQ